jgi:hypothetical protein
VGVWNPPGILNERRTEKESQAKRKKEDMHIPENTAQGQTYIIWNASLYQEVSGPFQGGCGDLADQEKEGSISVSRFQRSDAVRPQTCSA